MTVLESLALEGAKRAVRSFGITESRTAPKIEPAVDNDPGHVHFAVHFNAGANIDEAEAIVDVHVSQTGAPHGVCTCVSIVRTAGEFEYRYPYAWKTRWIYEHEVATAL